MAAVRICCECDQAIVGEAREIVRHSASGVRPNDWAHVESCPPRVAARSSVAHRLPHRLPRA